MSGYQFLITLSIMTMVRYHNDIDENYDVEDLLKELFQYLNVNVPFKRLFERYFEDPVNTGDVLLFKSDESSDFIVFDTFKEPYDQLDLIRIGAQVGENKELRSRELLRKLYDKSRIKINYQEGQFILIDLVDPSNYPKRIHKYTQLIKFY